MVKNSILFMTIVYTAVIIGAALIFIYLKVAKVNYIYNQF